MDKIINIILYVDYFVKTCTLAINKILYNILHNTSYSYITNMIVIGLLTFIKKEVLICDGSTYVTYVRVNRIACISLAIANVRMKYNVKIVKLNAYSIFTLESSDFRDKHFGASRI